MAVITYLLQAAALQTVGALLLSVHCLLIQVQFSLEKNGFLQNLSLISLLFAIPKGKC